MLMLLCTTAWATEVTLEYTGSTTGNMSGENDAALVGLDATAWSVVGEKGSASNMPGLNKDGDIRLYGNANGGNTLTVTSLSGATINSITITFTGANYSNAYVSVGGEDVTGSNGVYEIGNSAFVIGNANTNTTQVRIKKIVINYASDEPEAPTILLNGVAPATSYYVSDLPLSLTITSNNGTETPYYHYSFAADPETVSSTIRAGATELTTGESPALNLQKGSNKLWVAEAIPNTETQQWSSSQWASATFTIKEDPTTVANIAEFNALDDNTEVTFNGTVTVLGQKDSYLYAQDDEKGMLIYGSGLPSYQLGDKISGFKGNKTTFKGAPEMNNLVTTSFGEASGNELPTAIEMNIADVKLENFGRYGVIKGATVAALSGNNSSLTVGDATTSLALFNRFGIAAEDWPDQTKTYDVYGVASYYEANQFLPLQFVEVEAPVEFGITVTPATGDYTEPVTVTITPTGVGENEEVLITYNLKEEATPLTYDGPFTLYETTTVTVEAMNEAGTIKEWSGTYNITLPALKLKVTPGAGTYTEAQTVTASVEGTTYGDGDDDIEWMWEFTPASNAKTAAEGEGATVTVDESGTLHFLGIETISGREVEGDFVYVIDPNYQPAKYQLVTSAADLVANKNYLIVSTVDNDTYAMSEQRNNNRGASAETIAADGTITPSENARIIKLEGETNAWYLKVSSDVDGGYLYAASSSSNQLKTEQTQSVNSKAAITFENGVTSITFHESSNRNVLQFNLNTTNGVSNPIFACYASASQKPVVLYKEVEAGTTYTITPDKAPGAYDGMVLVKPVVDPALPEGAKIYYTFTEGTAKAEGETEVPATGVKLTKSGTLTFIARDADNAELARSERLAYTINSLFGDLNGDGEVDVADVNILVNIILGTYYNNNNNGNSGE